MASTISIRVYLIQVQQRGNRTKLSFDDTAGGIDVPSFISQFISDRSTTTEDKGRERSWYFEEKAEDGPGTSKGHIHYGIFGFESRLIDNATRKATYNRKKTDSEVIPLYYEFWSPPDCNHTFAVFQSFQGRSCVNSVMDSVKELFEKNNPGFLITYRKMIPNDSPVSIYKDHRVQSVTLIKRKVSKDVADKYSGIRPSNPVNLEVSLVARRKGNVGIFSNLVAQLHPNDAGVMIHEGLSFDEVTANVRVGKGTRRVGVFGVNGEAGVIDLTGSVTIGLNGHPEFSSIEGESDSILRDLHRTIGPKV